MEGRKFMTIQDITITEWNRELGILSVGVSVNGTKQTMVLSPKITISPNLPKYREEVLTAIGSKDKEGKKMVLELRLMK